MKLFTVMSTGVALALGLSVSGLALADDFIDASMSRISSTANGGGVPGNNVENNCGDAFAGATATVEVEDDSDGGGASVEIEIKDAVPDTHFTVWVRMGGSSHGTGFGGAPITGGGATPLAPTSELATLVDDWASAACGGIGPGGSGVARANGFFTDANGNGELKVDLDFPIDSGSYPFNRMSAATLTQAQCQRGAAEATPAVIVNPDEANVGGPFLFRMVSHCSDNASHGVSPAAREPWFQYP